MLATFTCNTNLKYTTMIRKLIKKCPPLLFIVRIIRTGFVTGQDLMLQLPHYVPLAEGPQRFRTRVTLQAARYTDLLLAELINSSSITSCNALPIEQFCSTESREKSAGLLAELFKQQGSDKSTSHNYHLLYGAIFTNRQD
jgi:hypothetical protein